MRANRGMVKLLLAGGLGALCAVAGFVSLAGGSAIDSVRFADVASRRDKMDVYGRLDKESIVSLKGANLVRFDLLEEERQGKDARLTGKRLTVLYENPAIGLPGNFPGASHAKCTGTYDPVSGEFVADRVLTKCPSKYEEQNLDVATQNAVEKWKKATGAASPGK